MNKEINKNMHENSEHTLVCLSASPSNEKIIKTAAKMAKAFGGIFTAVYVQSSDSDKMDETDKKGFSVISDLPRVSVLPSLWFTVTMFPCKLLNLPAFQG